MLLLNNVIHSSDIIQLINFLLRDIARKPFAFKEFKEILDMKSFPKDFIKNKYLMDDKTVVKSKIKTMYALPKRRKIPPMSWIGNIHLKNL